MVLILSEVIDLGRKILYSCIVIYDSIVNRYSYGNGRLSVIVRGKLPFFIYNSGYRVGILIRMLPAVQYHSSYSFLALTGTSSGLAHYTALHECYFLIGYISAVSIKSEYAVVVLVLGNTFHVELFL